MPGRRDPKQSTGAGGRERRKGAEMRRAGDRAPGDDATATAVAEPGPPPRLVDLASDWLALIAALRVAPELPDPAPLRERAQALRNDFERGARAAGFANEDIDASVFCLTAFFDETVRRARGKARDEWISRALQLEWFQTNSAGNEFYDRLEVLRKERGKRIEALEVAASCVALGFEGRLAVDRDKRAALLEDVLGEVSSARGAGDAPRAPHVTPRDAAISTVVPEMPRWMAFAGFALVLLVLWITISQVARLQAARAADTINQTSR